MTRQLRLTASFCILWLLFTVYAVQAQQSGASLSAMKSYPFPNELTSSAEGNKIAWAFNEEGKRNVYVAKGPDFRPQKLTAYNTDDGQEITSLSISADGRWVVYVRGGDHGSNWSGDQPVNATSGAVMPKVQIWSVAFEGGEPRVIAEGDNPVISPRGDSVVFTKGGQAWIAAISGGSAARTLFAANGATGSLSFSPDADRLAFVSSRGDHNLIGVYHLRDGRIQWVAPSFSRDNSPRWSPDGRRLVFVRTAGGGGAPDSILTRRNQPWSIYTADVSSGKTTEIYRSPSTLEGSVPTTHGSYNLHWAAQDRIVFLSYKDGWPHLYSIPSTGGEPLLLTPGAFMAEHIRMSHDKQWMYFAANYGTSKEDIDRRHVVRVPVDRPSLEALTTGDGLEWSPAPLADGASVALISATAQRPPLPAVLSPAQKKLTLLAEDRLPASFPLTSMVTPKQVVYKAPDGVSVHAQLFIPAGGGDTRRPAIIYVHGGPQRQMLLGWHYSDYYANAYATNQYLASKGFVVLSVNYRLGIGYGYRFHQPERGGRFGASEYQDIKAGALWLAAQPFVDRAKIGIYGGSYGGYLTALALARDSKIFAAGVDIHGVHDFTAPGRAPVSTGNYEKAPDLDSAVKVAWLSSPVSSVKSWTSPVLIIHADDDRNVPFSQSTDLVKRLEKKGVPMETMVIVDDTHHWMKHENAVKVSEATADFFQRMFLKKI